METPISQPEDQTPISSEGTTALESVTSKFSPVDRSVQKGRWISTQIFNFLAQFFDNLGGFFSTYKRFFIGLAVIIGAFVALRIVLAAMNALNEIPLVAPTFKLVGIGYSIWFVYRYLLKTSTRQELAQVLQNFLGNVSD